jgi:hypothetical protein
MSENLFGLTIPGTINTVDTSSITVGMNFKVLVDGDVTGVRFYKGNLNTGTHVVGIWTSAGTLLDSITVSGETSAGWQEQSFSSPISISADRGYTVGYFAPSGYYSSDSNYFTTFVTSGSIYAFADNEEGQRNGVYVYNSSLSYPTSATSASNYWVDFTFESSTSSSSSSRSSSSISSSSSSESSQSSSSTSTTERIHLWHYVLNDAGQPIENAEIRLYLQSAPTTEADIYLTPTAATSTTCSVADIKSDSDGYFEFWLEGESAEGGYAHNTEFILEWYKAGTAPGYIYNYNPWPNALVWRDVNTGTDTTNVNKFISNYLGYKWYQEHIIDGIIPSAAPHNIYPVDYLSGCDDNTYNKVVSNKFIYDIQVSAASASTYDLSGLYDGVQEHQELVTSWTSSGSIYVEDISHPNVTGDTVVRLVKTGSGYREIVPALIQKLNATTTRVALDDDVESWVTIQGSSSSSSSSSVTPF